MRKLAIVVLFSACGPAPAPGHRHGESGFHHRFEDAEKWAQKFDAPDRDAWQKPDDVISLMRIQPGMTIIDLGAGTGYFVSRLSQAVGPTGTVLALDIEPDMVRYMEARAAREGLKNVRPQLVAADGANLPTGEADRILIVDTWHHIEQRGAYSNKLAQALRPGGEVLVIDYTREASHGPPPEHRLPPEQVISELGQGGLIGKVASEDLPDQYAVRAQR